MAHRQPAPRPAGVRPDARRQAGLDAGKLPPLVATGSMIGAVRPEVAADLGISPSAQVVTGTPDLHSAALGCGADRRGPDAHDDQHHLLDLAARSRARRPTRSVRSRPSRGWIRRATSSPTTTRPPASACAGCGTASRWSACDFERLTELAARLPPGSGGVIFTPWIAGERSPVDDRNARAAAGTTSRSRHGTPIWFAPCSRASPTTRAGSTRLWSASPSGGSTRIRIFGGGAIPDLWCQIHADVMDRRIERVADPLHANLRGAALFAGARARRGLARRGPRPRAGRPGLRARSATRETYDRLYGSSRASTRPSARCSPGSTGSRRAHRHIVVTVCRSSGVVKRLCALKPNRS